MNYRPSEDSLGGEFGILVDAVVVKCQVGKSVQVVLGEGLGESCLIADVAYGFVCFCISGFHGNSISYLAAIMHILSHIYLEIETGWM